jgi:hypothetical protein
MPCYSDSPVHHTDLPFTDDDKQLGEVLASSLGDLFCDVFADVGPHDPTLRDRYFFFFYKTLTPRDTWTRVARALRSRGLRIVEFNLT